MRYTTVYNRTIDWSDPSPAEAAFLDQLEAAIGDDRVTPEQMLAMVYGPENPMLDHDIFPGQPMVTKATLDNLLFKVCIDYLTRKDVRLGRLNLEELHAAYTVDVPTAAEQLGVSPQAVRAGIDSFKYSALFAKGQWWMRPETVASLKLSREGGRLVKVPKPA